MLASRPVTAESQSARVTNLIQLAIDGDREAEDQLLHLIYNQLRNLAREIARHSNPTGSVSATELVNEVWMKVFHNVKPPIRGKQAFFSYVARAIRNLLVDHIRQRNSQTRGGDVEHIHLDELVLGYEAAAKTELLQLNEALEELKEENERQFRILELRFFGGMTMKQIAEHLGISLSTVESDWRSARAKLHLRLFGDSDS